MDTSRKRVEKTLVGLSIESTLLKIGKPVFDSVEKILCERYQCSIIDAYDNPQCLNMVLKEVLGSTAPDAVRTIEEFLTDFKHERPIEEFLVKINA